MAKKTTRKPCCPAPVTAGPTGRPSRRQFLRGAALLGGGLFLSGSLVRGLGGTANLALAAGAELADRHFIFCYFSGGWDLLLSLDPRDPAVFREDLKKVTRIQPGYHLLASDHRSLVTTAVPSMVFGPYIGRLAQHADRLAVVRGMSMDTLTHEVGRRRFITGKPPAGLQAKGSSMATVLAAQIGNEVPIPNLSVGVESYNEDLPSYASAIRVTSVTDLVRALKPGVATLGTAERTAVNELLAEYRGCTESRRRARGYESNDAALDLVSRGLSATFDFAAPGMAPIRARYGMANPPDMASGEAQAAMAVSALTSGISRVVSIEVARDIDAHGPTWASSHGPDIERGFNIIASMIEDLAARQYKTTSDSWLDHTTILVFSEFGRTALINSSSGRDHALTNACVLLGAGIRGGQVLGRSSDIGMAPMASNLQTGQVESGGTIIKPEHVHRALLASVGIAEDIVDLRAQPLSALLT